MGQNQKTSMERGCLMKSQKMENQTRSGHLDGLQNIDAEIEHRGTGTLDKIRDMIL